MVAVRFDDVFLLLWWWALWSLFDRYFIPYTPTSELLVCFVCFVWWASPRIPALLARGQKSVDAGLKRVTMTADIV